MANVPGVRVFSNPRWHDYQRINAYRYWVQSLNTTTLAPAPEALVLRHRYGIPKGHDQRRDATAQRSWTWTNNSTLLPGKDNISIRHRWGIPRGHEQLRDSTALRSWVWQRNNALLTLAPNPFSQDDWPLPRAYAPQLQQRTWTWEYNRNLIGKDDFPPGNIVDAKAPRAYPLHHQQRTWTWWYSLTLIGKDQLPVGDQKFALTPKGYIQPERSWFWTYNPNLVAQDQLPAGLVIDELVPRDYKRSPPSWAAWYNLNLVGKDQLPTGDIKDKRPPPVTWYRDWSQNLLSSTLSAPELPQNQFDWPNPRDYLRQTPSWAAWYNQNLVGQDEFPAGAISYELTQRPYPPQHQQRTWTWNYNLNLVGRDALPTGELVYERTPRGPLQPDRFWAWSYNLNLVAQDVFPAGLVIDELVPRDYKRGPPSWAVWYNLNLVGQDVLPTGDRHTDRPPPVLWFREWYQSLVLSTLSLVQQPFNQFDWPNPKSYLRGPPSLTAWYNQNLIGQDQFPAGAIHDERAPRDYTRAPPSWTAWYNQNLIAQDRLPAGEIYWDRPAPVIWYRDWSQNLQQSSLSIIFRPFNQFHWPLPVRGTPPPAPTWAWSYNLKLIGRDVVPGTRQFELVPRDYKRAPPSWAAWYNLNLVGKDVLPIGGRYTDWPLPTRRKLGAALDINATNYVVNVVATPAGDNSWIYVKRRHFRRAFMRI